MATLHRGSFSTEPCNSLPNNDTCCKLALMSEHRIEQAVERIEAALGRIANVADTLDPAPPSVSGLVVQHENLRETVSNSLKKLDEILEGLES